MSDLNPVVAATASLLPRVAKSRDNFDNFAIEFPAALYARRDFTELVDNPDHLADRIEAGAPTLPDHIHLSMQDLPQSVAGVCDDLPSSA